MKILLLFFFIAYCSPATWAAASQKPLWQLNASITTERGNFKINSELRINSLLEIGLSNGSPDYGLTIGMGLRF